MMDSLSSRPSIRAVADEWAQVKIILDALLELARAHPKKALMFFFFNLWVYSLMFQHLTELKSIWELIPFTH